MTLPFRRNERKDTWAKLFSVLVIFLGLVFLFKTAGNLRDTILFNPHKSTGIPVPSSFDELTDTITALAVEYLIKNHLIPPPSSVEPYNLSKFDVQKLRNAPFGEVLSEVTRNLLKYIDPKTKGFFIEAGANDGEFKSNTLQLEIKGWEGLLVEASPEQFQLLKQKRRKSWIADVCLTGNMRKMKFARYVDYKNPKHSYAAMGKPVEDDVPKDMEIEAEVDCFPLPLLLKAINRTRVDFMSLDLERGDLEVLQNFPFDKIYVKVMVVENGLGIGRRKGIHKMMEAKGYDVVLFKMPDSYFVKKGWTLGDK